MLVYAKTHKGLVRRSNQDALLVTSDIYGVADGMGGHKGGETASRLAVQVLKNVMKGKTPEERIIQMGIEAANRRVYESGCKDSALSGMGTTITLLWEASETVWIAHVGDSRAYLFRDGRLTQQTEDHSVVAELLKTKAITPELAAKHPYKNVITRALGIEPVVEADILSFEKREGDIWLICTDGLYNMVPDDQIVDALQSQNLEKTADKILELAIVHGGVDNVSFILGIVAEVNRA